VIYDLEFLQVPIDLGRGLGREAFQAEPEAELLLRVGVDDRRAEIVVGVEIGQGLVVEVAPRAKETARGLVARGPHPRHDVGPTILPIGVVLREHGSDGGRESVTRDFEDRI